MSFREFLRQSAIIFFIITTCVCLATAVVGPSLQPDLALGFDAFYSPLIGGGIGTLPAFILYSRKELSIRQTIARRAMHLAAIEAIFILLNRLSGHAFNLNETIVLVAAVFLVYAAVNVFNWLLVSREAKKINAALKSFQGRE